METINEPMVLVKPLTGRKPNGVMTVFSWELRRIAANRSTWIVTVLVSILFCIQAWFQLTPFVTFFTSQPFSSGAVYLYTPWGLLKSVPLLILPVCCLFLPFVSADGISLDLKRRTHELLMTSSISNRSYVLGRFLAVNLVGLALTSLMFVTILTSSYLFILIGSAPFGGIPVNINNLPSASPLAWLEIWAVIIVPPTLLLCSLSFLLGSLVRKHTNIIKISVVLGWLFLIFYMFNISLYDVYSFENNHLVYDHNTTSSLAFWDPTSVMLSRVIVENDYQGKFYQQFGLNYYGQVEGSALDQSTFAIDSITGQKALLDIQQQPPDLSRWVVPRLLIALVGPLLVLLFSLKFNRFSKELN